jgi:serpin B
VQQQDFAREPEKVRQVINEFIGKQTLGKIKELLAPGILSEQTKLVLANAIYFRGAWKAPFDETQTKKEAFYITTKKSVMVPTMSQEYTVNYWEDNLVQLVELPYKGRTEEQDDLSMMILLPKNAVDFQKIEQNLKDWVAPKKPEKQLVAIHLPKFTVESNSDLVDALKSLGVTDAFSQKDANFNGIGHDIFLSAVAHKAFVEVNEKGTEATASTAVVTTSRGVTPKAKEFRVNHPFIFWIKDNFFGTVLFLGRVTEPKI